MASFRTLFLAVYTSNSLIRVLFLPLCYLALSSPFVLAIAWYFGLGYLLQSLVPQDFSWFDVLPQIALSAVLLLLPTRLLSASGNAVKSKDGRKRRVQSLPYWIPGVRHLSSIVFGGEDWLKSIRDSSINNVVAYNTAATKHNVVLSESLLKQLYQHWDDLEVSNESQWGILRNAFKMPKTAKQHYFELAPETSKLIESEIYKTQQMEAIVGNSLHILTQSLPDLITLNSSIVDQMQWERVANVELTDGNSEAECDFFALVNDFCCNAILPPIVGAQFTESYQLLATDLASLNQRFWPLALGLPRLSPVQGLPGAALSQKRLILNFRNLFHELANPPVRRVPDDDESVSGEETDADIETPLVKLNHFCTKHDISIDARAALALQLVHEIMSEIVPLTFWTLLHIFSASDAQSSSTSVVDRIRTDTKTWAKAFQPPSIHPSFPAPPEIRFAPAHDITSPKSSTHLSSCINEARRLYTCSITTYKAKQPILLHETSDPRSGEHETWEIEPGSYIDTGLSSSLINSSPKTYTSATSFKQDRFLTSNTPPPPSLTCPHDPSQPFKTALLTALVAGITQLWDISPAPKKSFFDHLHEAGAEASISAAALGGDQRGAAAQAKKEKETKNQKAGTWVIPRAVNGACVKLPKTDVRVRIRRREGLPASKVVGRIG
ncbi:hypothetical protein ACN47E_003329 [Coniothyrium glycines]